MYVLGQCMTKDAKVSRLLATFNTLPESDKHAVIQFSESLLHREDGENGNMIKPINNANDAVHTNNEQYVVP
ncbi:hypothetical protein AGMMS49587_03440 [Spirochaetia bacterium]|nr:hypothetical protein AGMMS49587_03440 [Spirochaetia bacterium]